jgi:hypothetical protein
MYSVDNLVVYAMSFDREHLSGYHCYQCRLPAKEVSNLVKQGRPLTYDIVSTLVETERNSNPVEGCRVKAW